MLRFTHLGRIVSFPLSRRFLDFENCFGETSRLVQFNSGLVFSTLSAAHCCLSFVSSPLLRVFFLRVLSSVISFWSWDVLKNNNKPFGETDYVSGPGRRMTTVRVRQAHNATAVWHRLGRQTAPSLSFSSSFARSNKER